MEAVCVWKMDDDGQHQSDGNKKPTLAASRSTSQPHGHSHHPSFRHGCQKALRGSMATQSSAQRFKRYLKSGGERSCMTVGRGRFAVLAKLRPQVISVDQMAVLEVRSGLHVLDCIFRVARPAREGLESSSRDSVNAVVLDRS